jgi:hypothetical protein
MESSSAVGTVHWAREKGVARRAKAERREKQIRRQRDVWFMVCSLRIFTWYGI